MPRVIVVKRPVETGKRPRTPKASELCASERWKLHWPPRDLPRCPRCNGKITTHWGARIGGELFTCVRHGIVPIDWIERTCRQSDAEDLMRSWKR